MKLVIPYTLLSRTLFPVNSRRGKKRCTRLFFMYTDRSLRLFTVVIFHRDRRRDRKSNNFSLKKTFLIDNVFYNRILQPVVVRVICRVIDKDTLSAYFYIIKNMVQVRGECPNHSTSYLKLFVLYST